MNPTPTDPAMGGRYGNLKPKDQLAAPEDSSDVNPRFQGYMFPWTEPYFITTRRADELLRRSIELFRIPPPPTGDSAPTRVASVIEEERVMRVARQTAILQTMDDHARRHSRDARTLYDNMFSAASHFDSVPMRDAYQLLALRGLMRVAAETPELKEQIYRHVAELATMADSAEIRVTWHDHSRTALAAIGVALAPHARVNRDRHSLEVTQMARTERAAATSAKPGQPRNMVQRLLNLRP